MEERLERLREFKDLSSKDLSKQAEMVMKVDHICNANLMTAAKEGIQ